MCTSPITADPPPVVTWRRSLPPVRRAEAARLKNENLALRKELEDQRARISGATPEKASGDSREGKTPAASRKAERAPRTYVVRQGDTLASISRKFYKSSAKWKKIRDANRSIVDDPGKLKAGQTLTIP